jgi:fructokinase
MTSLGIDLGGTKIEGAVLDGDEIRVRKRIATEAEHGYDHVVARVAALVAELRSAAPGADAVGIGTPGSLSARAGLLKNSNTQCLNGKPLLRDLERAIGLPLRMENDANCFALAEATRGAGRGHEVVFGVILGTGVGGGIVLGGRCWTGPQHIAGEWGHHSIDPAGPPCYCGHRGCVESLLAGPALERSYRDAAGRAAQAPEIAALAGSGDAIASAVLDQYLGRFGRALANVIDILDPSIVVLGGGLSNLAALYDRGREEVAARVFNDELTTPIVRHELGDSAGVVGAALLARSAAP